MNPREMLTMSDMSSITETVVIDLFALVDKFDVDTPRGLSHTHSDM